jgi:hypothetical protein
MVVQLARGGPQWGRPVVTNPGSASPTRVVEPFNRSRRRCPCSPTQNERKQAADRSDRASEIAVPGSRYAATKIARNHHGGSPASIHITMAELTSHQPTPVQSKPDWFRTMTRDLANEREGSLRLSQNYASLRARLSNKARPTPRRNPIVDRDILEQIHMCLDHRAVVRVTGDAGPAVIRLKRPIYADHRTHFDNLLKKARRKLKTREIWEQQVWIPEWSHTHDILKIWAFSMLIHEEGGLATSVNLSKDVIEAASAHHRGFSWYIRDRIQKELRVKFSGSGFAAPDFFFVLEASNFHQVHLHGGVCRSHHPKSKMLVRDALFSIGRHQSRSGREVDTPGMSTATKWARYVTKWFLGTQLHVEGPIYMATNGLRSRTESWYCDARSSKLAVAPYNLNDDPLTRVLLQGGSAATVRHDIQIWPKLNRPRSLSLFGGRRRRLPP